MAHQGRKRWIVSLELVDAARFTWGIRVEEAVGNTLVQTAHYAPLRLALTHHAGVADHSGWQPLQRLAAPRRLPWADKALNLDDGGSPATRQEKG